MEQFDISKMISEVEAYVGLPAGTIRPFFSEADHWVFVLKISSILETVLKSAIIARIDQSGPQFYGGLGALLLSGGSTEPWRRLIYRLPLNGDIGAIPLAKRYRLLDAPDEAFIQEVLAIRNRYAHSIANHSKTALQIVSENKNQNQIDAVRRRLHYSKEFYGVVHKPAIIDEMEFGTLMFLAGMSGRLRPTESPPGGLLAELMREGAPSEPSPEADGSTED
jgi:hypothetical protein